METVTPFLQCVAIAGIILAIGAEFLFKSKEIRMTSLALGLLAAIGVWVLDVFVRFPISEARGSATLLFQSNGSGKDWKSAGMGTGSTLEIFRNDTCLLKLGSSRMAARGLENGLSVFKNEYSIAVPGSYIHADFKDMEEIDSVVVFDPGFPSQVKLIHGAFDLTLNGSHSYRIHIYPMQYESKRINARLTALERYRIEPEEKSDFGSFTLDDGEMAGAWIGSRTFSDKRFIFTSILAAELTEDHTYTATVQTYLQPLELLSIQYQETGFWKSHKGRIQVIPQMCEGDGIDTEEWYGVRRIPCNRKHALAFGYSGGSLGIGRFSEGEFITYPMEKL